MKHLFLLLVLTIAAHAQWHPDTIWTRAGAGEQSRYGARIWGLGDQNADGFADWAIAGAGWGNPGGSSERRFDLFCGQTNPSNIPYLSFPVDTTDLADFGGQGALGDLNGDGYIDWGTGYAYRSAPNTWTFGLHWGGPSASSMPDLVMHFDLSTGPHPIGDFNGDGFDDLYIYDYNADSGWALFGSAVFDTIPDWILHSHLSRSMAQIFEDAGDLNGDGFSDVFSQGQRDSFFVFYGSAQPDTTPRIVWDQFSVGSPAIVNDLNGDGKDELVAIGSSGVLVFLGRDTLQRTADFILRMPMIYGEVEIHGVGDINHDSYGDFILTAEMCVACESGVAVLYLGHPWLNPDPVWTLYGGFNEGELIGMRTSAGLGDVNGDSVGDFALGAWNGMSYGWRGRAMIFAGDSTLRVDADDPPIFQPSSFSVSVYPNPFNSTATIEFELSAGERKVDFTICDITGRLVFEHQLQPVSRRVSYRYNADNLSSGIYFLHAQTNQTQTTQKLVLIK